MSEAVSFPMKGGDILIEVEDARGLKPVSAGKTIKQAEETFDAALGSVSNLASSFHEALTEMVKKPDSVTVEFSVKLSAKAGVIVASGGGEANFKISLNWKGGAGT